MTEFDGMKRSSAERGAQLMLAFFTGALVMFVIAYGIAWRQVEDLEQKHKVSQKAAVHFATEIANDDLQECEGVATVCGSLLGRCVSALGRDSSEPAEIPVEL